MIPLLLASFMGGIGGGLGALETLPSYLRHRQVFDDQHNVHFLIQPILGVVLGRQSTGSLPCSSTDLPPSPRRVPSPSPLSSFCCAAG